MTTPSYDEAFRRQVQAHVAAYREPSSAMALETLAATAAAYALCLGALPPLAERAAAGPLPARVGFGLAALVVFAGLVGTQVRTFMLHHDLCHGSFFASPRLNRWVAVLVGTLVSTSPSVWKREHDRHHRDSNKLDREQDGQTASWTLQRYLAAPRWQRVLYWTLNQRAVLFVLVPPLYFFGFMRARARVVENLAFAGYAALLWGTERLGWFVVSASLASVAGFLLFHAQHTFDGVVRRPSHAYDFFDNGMRGSSLLVLPRWPVLGRALEWFAYAVEYHHVHHLNPGVPGYRLVACHRDGAALFDAVPRVTLSAAVNTTRYSLYDTRRARFVSVSEHSPW